MKQILKAMRLPNQLAQTDKQATWKLLTLLRLVAFFSVVALFAVAELFDLHVLQMVADWNQITITSMIAMMLSIVGLFVLRMPIILRKILLTLWYGFYPVA